MLEMSSVFAEVTGQVPGSRLERVQRMPGSKEQGRTCLVTSWNQQVGQTRGDKEKDKTHMKYASSNVAQVNSHSNKMSQIRNHFKLLSLSQM